MARRAAPTRAGQSSARRKTPAVWETACRESRDSILRLRLGTVLPLRRAGAGGSAFDFIPERAGMYALTIDRSNECL